MNSRRFLLSLSASTTCHRQMAQWCTSTALAAINRYVLATLQNHQKWLQQSRGWINIYPARQARLITCTHYMVCKWWSAGRCTEYTEPIVTATCNCFYKTLSPECYFFPYQDSTRWGPAPPQDTTIMGFASLGSCGGYRNVELSSRELLYKQMQKQRMKEKKNFIGPVQ